MEHLLFGAFMLIATLSPPAQAADINAISISASSEFCQLENYWNKTNYERATMLCGSPYTERMCDMWIPSSILLCLILLIYWFAISLDKDMEGY